MSDQSQTKIFGDGKSPDFFLPFLWRDTTDNSEESCDLIVVINSQKLNFQSLKNIFRQDGLKIYWLGLVSIQGTLSRGTAVKGWAKKNLSQPFVIRSSTSRMPYHQFCIEYVHCQEEEGCIEQRAKKHGSRVEESFCTSGIFFVKMMKILFLVILPSPGKYQVISIPIPYTIGQLVLTLPW